MKKYLVVIMAVMAITGLLTVPALAADKLIVKDGAAATRFVVNTNDTTNIGSLGLNVAAPIYNFDLSAGNVSQSLMHFSLNGTDDGGYFTTVGPTNFFLSAGIMYDGNGASGAGWYQKSSSGVGVVIGGDSPGLNVFTSSGGVVGNKITLSSRLKISASNGYIGIGNTSPAFPLHVGTNGTNGNGAHVTVGGVWTNGSSRDFKENIQTLSAEAAMATVRNLQPVTYAYKVDPSEKHVGFIAEDVPDLVATPDRKYLSPMDIVAVLTKVVQEQNKTIEALSAKLDMIEKASRNNKSL